MSGTLKKTTRGGRMVFVSSGKEKNVKELPTKDQKQKSFSKRKDTLLSKARELELTTGAMVMLVIVAPSGARYEYESGGFHSKSKEEDVMEEEHSRQEVSPPEVMNSDDDGPVAGPSSSSSSLPIFPSPERKKAKKEATNTSTGTQTTESYFQQKFIPDMCQICGEVEKDRLSVVTPKRKKADATPECSKMLWVGCQSKLLNCEYWVHATCWGIFAKTKSTINKVKFMCPRHTE